ncbi:hypothetical protein Q7C36_018275 [Tachysurus vachellii]|uniref:Uncharacterized protein n=1 Tax=Tachysurus vachellii TaxID=175792 RepID=A0AA88LZE7_TACVA|nr:hypothetical protein Q7C36_018275 [Tachysurus vachellii]
MLLLSSHPLCMHIIPCITCKGSSLLFEGCKRTFLTKRESLAVLLMEGRLGGFKEGHHVSLCLLMDFC